jgi:hypothetical protein
VTARSLATVAVVWHYPRPKECGPAPRGGFASSNPGIAADGPLVAISIGCSPVFIVQRLDVATGKVLWSWKSPVAVAGAMYMTVTGAARHGGVLLVTGGIGPASAAERFTAGLPHPYQWPVQLGPSDQTSVVLALDAADGHARWSELGGQQVAFSLTEGAVCETVLLGQECRDDTTGAPTLPVLVTRHNPDTAGYTAISGGLTAVTVAPFQSGEVTLRIMKIRGGATVARARVPTGQIWPGGTPDNVVAVAAGPLPGGATLVLLDADNLDGPLLALRVPPLHD